MSREYKVPGRRLYINETVTSQYKVPGRRLYINETVAAAPTGGTPILRSGILMSKIIRGYSEGNKTCER